ncbi:cobalamin-5'-phosphate synthase [Bacteroides zoogleoformans]|uniref:Adenosylcobinamide-GDP ribazoletransferase n=1 Tax=Bacteroides zoogleoformans TaxID=28119 RepID=A0ABN5IGA0_9BACE|nr:adenosylcobinamide-GDP ribazoletransferase [Bacteroides zoogleoformans]AVM51696.1 adenosylcobinamide-GDP ribazoletransferase [Bacteroides zoogleoformans]TWJ16754.1 cobalamin-5'-phosphate synthase [Bacteroides zoogleoformans]
MNNILAAFILLTRLPFWRIKKVPAESFKHIVPYWPLVGWLTGGIMAAALWSAAQILPLPTAWGIAIVVRLFISGCLHEDGLADFFDGFGGGSTREHTLSIMKDSHIGSYGVIGLICYFLLLWQLYHLPLRYLCILVLCGDCWSKCCASQIVNFLPYARKEGESKTGVVYNRMTSRELSICLIAGLLPLTVLLPVKGWIVVFFPIATFALLYLLMKRRLQGYTGDCCGATFLLCELSFYIGSLIIIHPNIQ